MGAEVDGAAAEEALIIARMAFEEGLPGAAERLAHFGIEIVVAAGGPGAEDEDGFGGAVDGEGIAGDGSHAVVEEEGEAEFEFGAAGAGFAFIQDLLRAGLAGAVGVPEFGVFPLLAAFFDPFEGAAKDEAGDAGAEAEGGAAEGFHAGGGVDAAEACAEREGAVGRGEEAEDEDAVGEGGETFAGENGFAAAVGDAGEGGFEVELAAVGFDGTGAGDGEEQIAGRLVALP